MSNPYQSPSSNVVDSTSESSTYKRHGFLTTLLILMLIGNVLTSLSTAFLGWGSGDFKKVYPSINNIEIAIIFICSISNIVFIGALFKWRRWGFYGLISTALIAIIINHLIGVSLIKSLFGLSGLLLLYWALHMGGERRAWPLLK